MAFTVGVYAVFGSLALIAGIVALIAPDMILPDAHTPVMRHLIREEAALFVFVGMMVLWCVRNFERRHAVHAGLVVFTGLFAVIHWLGFFDDHRVTLSAIANTVPFVVFLATMPRARTAVGEKRPAAMA
jgi:uncharacterized protein DUF4345